MGYIYSFGEALQSVISNVQLLEDTTDHVTLAFAAGLNTTEKGIRNLLIGTPEEHAANHCTFTLEEQVEDGSGPKQYYGYTKLSHFELYTDDSGTNMCKVTLRKPTVDEFIEDIYYKVCSMSDELLVVTANVGGAYGELAADATKIMMSQIGGM